jgi:hypothetical protein
LRTASSARTGRWPGLDGVYQATAGQRWLDRGVQGFAGVLRPCALIAAAALISGCGDFPILIPQATFSVFTITLTS